MDWLYVWSPRYRFFHELLQSTTSSLQGFHIQPVFAEQHLFKPIDTTQHFLTGIPIKIHVIVKYIERNMGKTFFFTDVDLILFPEFSREDLQPYMENDITSMMESHAIVKHNIGCLLIRCTPETLAFFQRVLERIRTEKLLDQYAFHLELESFPGRIGQFSDAHFAQSNMLRDDETNYKIVQCLTSESDPAHVLVEKVLTIMSVFDVSEFLQYLPEDVQQILESVSRDDCEEES
jgi:hypothetical protein